VLIEVCRGPGLGLMPQIVFGSLRGSGVVQTIAISHYKEHFGLSRAILFP
jgi:hypothetical protein